MNQPPITEGLYCIGEDCPSVIHHHRMNVDVGIHRLRPDSADTVSHYTATTQSGIAAFRGSVLPGSHFLPGQHHHFCPNITAVTTPFFIHFVHKYLQRSHTPRTAPRFDSEFFHRHRKASFPLPTSSTSSAFRNLARKLHVRYQKREKANIDPELVISQLSFHHVCRTRAC